MTPSFFVEVIAPPEEDEETIFESVKGKFPELFLDFNFNASNPPEFPIIFGLLEKEYITTLTTPCDIEFIPNV